MNEFWLPLLAGAVTGVLSGFGVGGGTLLLVYMTAFAGLEQQTAQGINLLYFLPAIAAGLVCSGLGAWAATGMDSTLLRKCFGGFLVLVGLWQLLVRDG